MLAFTGFVVSALAGWGAYDLSARVVRWTVNRWRARDFAERVAASVEADS